MAILVTQEEYDLAVRCVKAPQAHGLTEPEIRACVSVIRNFISGTPMNENDTLVAKALFEVLTEEAALEAESRDGGNAGISGGRK